MSSKVLPLETGSKKMTKSIVYDYVLVGGGLQAGLLALAIKHHQPQSQIIILERETVFSGKQTWSCHQTDIPENCRSWFAQIPRITWPSYLVRMRGFQRNVEIGYQSIRSSDFNTFLRHLSNDQSNGLSVKRGIEVTELGCPRVELHGGHSVRSKCTIDCRGPLPVDRYQGLGYQKFFGWEVELDTPWVPELPVIMDVNTDQEDGFRFFYALPFTKNRILLQDTRFSDHADVDMADGAIRLREYLHRQGHSSFTVVREEHGCLPMPFASSPIESSPTYLEAGYRGNWFHAATGYSLPLAVQYADAVARVAPEQAEYAVSRLWQFHRGRSKVARLLHRMLLRVLTPSSRHQIFQHFYKSLPESTISRFYSHKFSQLDRMRLFLRMPPAGLTPVRFLQSFKVNR